MAEHHGCQALGSWEVASHHELPEILESGTEQPLPRANPLLQEPLVLPRFNPLRKPRRNRDDSRQHFWTQELLGRVLEGCHPLHSGISRAAVGNPTMPRMAPNGCTRMRKPLGLAVSPVVRHRRPPQRQLSRQLRRFASSVLCHPARVHGRRLPLATGQGEDLHFFMPGTCVLRRSRPQRGDVHFNAEAARLVEKTLRLQNRAIGPERRPADQKGASC